MGLGDGEGESPPLLGACGMWALKGTHADHRLRGPGHTRGGRARGARTKHCPANAGSQKHFGRQQATCRGREGGAQRTRGLLRKEIWSWETDKPCERDMFSGQRALLVWWRSMNMNSTVSPVFFDPKIASK